MSREPETSDRLVAEIRRLRAELEARESGAAIRASGGVDRLDRLLAAEVPICLAYVDSDERYCFVNAEYEKWLGRSRDALVGKTVKDVIGDEAYEVVRDYVKSALEGKRVSYEAYVPYASGSPRHIHGELVPDIDGTGVVSGYFLVIQDITLRKNAESELRDLNRELEERVAERTARLQEEVDARAAAEKRVQESKTTIEALLNATTDAAFLLDRDGRYLALNDACAQRHAMPREDLLGLCAFDLLPEDAARRRRGWVAEVIATGKPIRFQDTRAGLKLDNSMFPVFGSDGSVETVAIFSRDVTEQVRSQEALEESQTLLRHALEGANMGLWDWNLQTGIGTISARGAHVVGLGELDVNLTLETWRELVHPEDWPTVLDSFERHCSGITESYEVEYRLRIADDEWLWVHVLGRVTEHDETGRPSRIAGTVLDISELRRTEDALRRSNALLEASYTAHNEFVGRRDPPHVFDHLLDLLLDLTQSEFGFIDEVFYADDGRPFRRTHAITNISWDEETRRFYDAHAAQGFVFSDNSTLSGAILTTGEPVVSNDPADDPRSKGLPEGHPRIVSFLGLPLVAKGRIIGTAGIANRPGGYDEQWAEYLKPYLTTCANIIVSHRAEERRLDAERALRESKALLESILENLPVAVFLKDARELRFQYVNKALSDLAGLPAENLLGKSDFDFVTHDQAEAFISDDREVLRKGLRKDIQEEAVQVRGGAPKIFRTSKVPVMDEDGSPSFLLGITQDVTAETENREQIRKALVEKEILLRELHHRVKNNLAVISSMLSLQARYIKDPETLALLRDLQSRIRSMAAAHEILYRSEDLAFLSIRTYLLRLVNYLQFAGSKTGSSVAVNTEIDERFVGVDTAVRIGFIVTELVSNALKHAFPAGGSGRVDVILRIAADGSAVLIVEDDGVGLPPDFDIEKPKSVGLELIQAFIEQLNARLFIGRQDGALFEIRFMMPEENRTRKSRT